MPVSTKEPKSVILSFRVTESDYMALIAISSGNPRGFLGKKVSELVAPVKESMNFDLSQVESA